MNSIGLTPTQADALVQLTFNCPYSGCGSDRCFLTAYRMLPPPTRRRIFSSFSQTEGHELLDLARTMGCPHGELFRNKIMGPRPQAK